MGGRASTYTQSHELTRKFFSLLSLKPTTQSWTSFSRPMVGTLSLSPSAPYTRQQSTRDLPSQVGTLQPSTVTLREQSSLMDGGGQALTLPSTILHPPSRYLPTVAFTKLYCSTYSTTTRSWMSRMGHSLMKGSHSNHVFGSLVSFELSQGGGRGVICVIRSADIHRTTSNPLHSSSSPLLESEAFDGRLLPSPFNQRHPRPLHHSPSSNS